jgi:anti-sigma regulatory factor (Ser/Thr protein kinase)
MPGEIAAMTESSLILKSRLDELASLWAWVESLGAEYAIPADTQFAIQLCLEEALSNLIRHGYQGEPDHSIRVEFTAQDGEVGFVVEDHAPPFDPLAADAANSAPAPRSIDELPLGGRGIGLMRKFSAHIAYEPLDGGNRLTLRFPLRKEVPQPGR